MKHLTYLMLVQRSCRLLASGLCVASTVAATGLALAQTVPNAGSLLKELRDGERAPQVNETPDVISAPARPTLRLPEGTTVQVAAFKITGNTLIATEVLEPLVKEWAGKTLDLAGLNEASGALTRYYQARGYILSYAYLPAQKVENNIIEIAILEGRLGAVQVVAAQDVRLDDQVIQAHIGADGDAQPAHKDALERKLLLLNEIPGVVARAAFTPGVEPGSSDMVVSVVEDTPLASSVYVNNYGSKATGEYRMGAQFQLRDVFGAGDSTQVGATWSTGGGLASGSVESSVPWGGNGLSLRAGVSHLTYALQQSFSDLGARGVADSVHAGAWYALQRSAYGNISLRSDLQYSGLRDLLSLVAVETRKSSSVLTLGVNMDAQDDILGGGQSRSQMSYQMGNLQIESGTDAAFTGGPFGKVLLDVSREQRFTANTVLYARALAQQANKNLDSSEKLALSGPNAVRAYAPGELSVDDGGLLTLEYRIQFPMQGGTLTWSFFGDWGTGSTNHVPLTVASENEASVNGAGLGLSWRNGADMEASLSMAWRGVRMPTADSDRVPRVFFQLVKGL
jgi:hemolysin activation/secretion protein